jgi:hypothetical protein
MKRYLFLLVFIYSSQSVYARNLAKPVRIARHFPGEISSAEILARQQSIDLAKKTTALPLRLLGWGYSMNGTEVDSAWNYYSGGRGSTHPNRATYTNEYFPGEVQYIQSDSSIYWQLQGASLKISNFRSCVYDNNNKVISFYYRDQAVSYKQNLSYTNGLISGITLLDSTGGTFSPARQTVKSYNSQGYLITDSLYNLPSNSPYYKTIYSYDAGNNLVLQESYEYQSGNWHLSYRITNTYNNNLLITSVREIDAPGGLVKNTRDSLGYSGTNVVNESAYDWDVQLASWGEAYRTTYHYNTQNFVDTFYVQQPGANKWDTTEKDALIYDTNNLIVSSSGYLFQNDSFATTPYDNQKYYYESYFPASANALTTDPYELNLFPNPANDVLYIKTTIENTGDISITNLLGQRIYTSEHVSLSNLIIDTKALPPGNYIIKVQATNGYISQKQFTKI